MDRKKFTKSYKIGKASQILQNEAYFAYAAVMRNAALLSNWTFYEAINNNHPPG